jgi:hypothetical protein
MAKKRRGKSCPRGLSLPPEDFVSLVKYLVAAVLVLVSTLLLN